MALSDANRNLVVRVYNSAAEAWEGGNIAPVNNLTQSLLGDPTIIAKNDVIIVAWQKDQGLVRAAGAVVNGSVTLNDVALIAGSDMLTPHGGPMLAKSGATFYLGYLTSVQVPPPNGGRQRDQVVVLSSSDGQAWSQYAMTPNPQNAHLTLRGVATHADSVLIVDFDDTTGWNVVRYASASAQWTTLTNAFGPIPANVPMAVFATGPP